MSNALQATRAHEFDEPLPIFDVVHQGENTRGPIVGKRVDLEEALDFAGEGLVTSLFASDRLENINLVFEKMREGKIEARPRRKARSGVKGAQ